MSGVFLFLSRLTFSVNFDLYIRRINSIMQLSPENGEKKNIIAERILDSGIPNNLCNLFVCDFDDFRVMSYYSALSKKFIGYKVLISQGFSFSNTSEEAFNAIYQVSLDPDFELIPKGFMENGASKLSTEFEVNTPLHRDEVHIAYGLEKLAAELNDPAVWVFSNEEILSIFIAKNKTLVFANSFAYKDQTEFLYFILNALSIADLRQEEASVFLDYRSMKKFGLMEFLGNYFHPIQPLAPPFENPDEELEDLPYLLAYNHLASLCV